ncbi:hypothetical protein Tco_0143984 [Tanacetum coccineum]
MKNQTMKMHQTLNGNSKKRISTGRDGIVRVLSPVTAAEIQAVEKERKAKNILLMAIPKEHMRRFHGMDDAKEICVRHSELVWLEKGFETNFNSYFHHWKLNGAEISTEDAIIISHILPRAWQEIQEDWELLQEDLDKIYDVYYEEMDINWQIAMIAIRMKKFYKKTGRRVRVDGKTPKKRDSFYQHQEAGKQEKNQMGLLTMDDGIVNWGEHTEAEETNHALMAISSSNEVNRHESCQKKEQLQKIVDSWKDSSKNLWRLIDSGMSSSSKLGLGYEIKSNNEVLSYEEEMNFSVFKCSKEDSIGKPSYSRFTKTNDFKGVPHPLSGDYTPRPQEEIDDSLYVYGKKGPQKPEISVSDDNSSEHSTCQSNDSEGSCGNTSEHSFETESESLSEPNEMSKSRLEVTNEKDVSAPKSKEVEPSCVSHIKTPRQPLKDKETHKVNRKNWNDMMERELGEGYSFTKKKCFVCGSLSHLIKDCDYYEKKMARGLRLKGC